LSQVILKKDQRHCTNAADLLPCFCELRHYSLGALDERNIPTISAETLNELRAYLEFVQDTFAKKSISDGFRQQVYDFLYDDRTGLPTETYTEQDVDMPTDQVFQHFRSITVFDKLSFN